MARTHANIGDDLREWIRAQQVFFVGTAPLSGEGHVNCSPKGGDTLRVLDDQHVAYLDRTGSGAETIAHLRENGRIVVMFCAFTGPPRIVRLHGRGTIVLPSDPEFAALRPLFPPTPGGRALIKVEVSRIADSCGFAVPLYDFVAQRDQLDRWAEAKGPEGLAAYRRLKNQQSIDGLPAYPEVTVATK